MTHQTATILTLIRDAIHRHRAEHAEDPTVLLLTTERYDELNDTAAFQAMRLFGQSEGAAALRFGDMNIFVARTDEIDPQGVEVFGEASALVTVEHLQAARTA